ncbi:hypothetical protein [Agrococcus sp. KRD186]|uniref:hypothetical protein n=1 Tax=Agrococcus sp. KRD186 TaxID=2729730 RepID=UPI0019D30A18|nr:hypothetical protein [Agrococcus sp. KRD186]
MTSATKHETHRHVIVALIAAIALVLSFFLTDSRAQAVEEAPSSGDGASLAQPGGTSVAPEEWDQAIAELLASDVPRTVESGITGQEYTFHVPVSDPLVPSGSFDLVVFVPSDELVQPTIGGGWDNGGPYILLNNFDQQLIVGGGGAALTAALCAIPGLGTVSCIAIIAAVVAAGTWIANYGTCPGNLKSYVFGPRFSCVG